MFIEKLSFRDAFYLTVVSMTTVGYGDLSFKSWNERFFACEWLIVSILSRNIFSYALSVILKECKRQRNLTIEDDFFRDPDPTKTIRYIFLFIIFLLVC
ncbi:Two-pore potassium channel 3 [Platanthera guangdongensis]|uniref:Two-pore potassium channel 3 n=1 Tax=Platanthera guangdongensis TaxID=2320717 RepID=A0ABR2MBU1_9ASPA